ncbi:hypothetical protein ACFL4G_05435 [Thermodesulfobacteriota bacterium]
MAKNSLLAKLKGLAGPFGPGPALLVNGVLLGGLALLSLIHSTDRSLYYILVREDGLVEWMTVASLVLTGVLTVVCAHRWYRILQRFPWFYIGLGLFCVFFAGEELSWGQRLLSYQPPDYFLEHNSQQELNVHNLFKHILRTKYLLMGILVGYGVLLPALNAFFGPVRRFLHRLGVVTPPLALLPGWLTTYFVLREYQWKYTGEVAECLFALGLYFMVFIRLRQIDPEGERQKPHGSRSISLQMGAGTAAVLVVAWSIPSLLSVARADPAKIELARAEAVRLKSDWFSQRAADDDAPSGCRTHIRIFTWVNKHDYDAFRKGLFFRGQAIEDGSGEASRGKFFVDPWNNPYWVRQVCGDEEDMVYIYSFGPNGRRDSDKEGLKADDVGVAFAVP